MQALYTHHNGIILGLEGVSPHQKMDAWRYPLTAGQIPLKMAYEIVKNADFRLKLPLGFHPLVALLFALCTTYCGFLFTENQSFVWIGPTRLCT
jgi:hypothetical protein